MRIIATLLIAAFVAGLEARAQEVKAAQVKLKARLENELRLAVRAYVRSELRFARSACDLSTDEYKAIAKDALAQRDRLAKELLPAYLERGKAGPKAAAANPVARIEHAVAEVVKARATPGQRARYQDEADLRGRDRTEAAVELLLVKMDGELVLSNRQRGQIRRVLVDHWNPAWSPAAIGRSSTGGLKIPDDPVAPLLSGRQKAIWLKQRTLDLDPFAALEFARKFARVVGGQDMEDVEAPVVKGAKP